jgi:hypothetical protein
MHVFAYSLRTDKSTSTKYGMLAPLEEEEILERQTLSKRLFSEGGSCSLEMKQDRIKVPRAKWFLFQIGYSRNKGQNLDKLFWVRFPVKMVL